jgi:hypothetical protein
MLIRMNQKTMSQKDIRGAITIRADTKAMKQQGSAKIAPVFFMAAGLCMFLAIDSAHQESSNRIEKVASDVAVVQNYVDTSTNKVAALDAIKDLKIRGASDIASNLVSKATDWDFVNAATLVLGDK